MLTSRLKQNGFSIIELLIALTISMVVALGILGAFSSSLFGSQQILEKGRLDRDLQTVMDAIVSDIQRAGYWENATTSNTNPFMTTGIDLSVTGNCIMMAYDLNNNGTLDDADELGYVLHNNAIERRPAGLTKPGGGTYTTSCASAATDGWEAITDVNFIKVTAFTLSKTNVATSLDAAAVSSNTINNRTISITITGELANDATTTKTITRTVIKAYNNKFSP